MHGPGQWRQYGLKCKEKAQNSLFFFTPTNDCEYIIGIIQTTGFVLYMKQFNNIKLVPIHDYDPKNQTKSS